MKNYYIPAGEFNQQIQIQKSTIAIVNGKPMKTQVNYGGLKYAKWQWLHGEEIYQAAAINSKAVAQVTIRYFAGILPDMQIIFKTKTYQILPPVDNIQERNRYTTFKVFDVENG